MRCFQRLANNNNWLIWCLQELELVNEDDGNVFKLHGPVLIKQDVAEAKINVGKRLEFMRSKIKDIDSDIEKKQADMAKSKKKLEQIKELFINAQNQIRAQAQKASA